MFQGRRWRTEKACCGVRSVKCNSYWYVCFIVWVNVGSVWRGESRAYILCTVNWMVNFHQIKEQIDLQGKLPSQSHLTLYSIRSSHVAIHRRRPHVRQLVSDTIILGSRPWVVCVRGQIIVPRRPWTKERVGWYGSRRCSERATMIDRL